VSSIAPSAVFLFHSHDGSTSCRTAPVFTLWPLLRSELLRWSRSELSHKAAWVELCSQWCFALNARTVDRVQGVLSTRRCTPCTFLITIEIAAVKCEAQRAIISLCLWWRRVFTCLVDYKQATLVLYYSVAWQRQCYGLAGSRLVDVVVQRSW